MMRNIEDIMVKLLDLKTTDGGLVSSVNVNNWTITLSVEDDEKGLACVSLSPAQARVLAAFWIERADEIEARRTESADAAEKAPTGLYHVDLTAEETDTDKIYVDGDRLLDGSGAND